MVAQKKTATGSKRVNPVVVPQNEVGSVPENLSLSNKGQSTMSIVIQACSVSTDGKGTKAFTDAYPDSPGYYHVHAKEAGQVVILSDFDNLPESTKSRLISLGLNRHISVGMIPDYAGKTKLVQLEEMVAILNGGYTCTRGGSTAERAPTSKIMSDDQLQSKALLGCVNAGRKAKQENAYTAKDWAAKWAALSVDSKATWMTKPAVASLLASLTAINDAYKAVLANGPVTAPSDDEFGDL